MQLSAASAAISETCNFAPALTPRTRILITGKCGCRETFQRNHFQNVKNWEDVTPYCEIDWNRLSRISDEEMRALMLSTERALESAFTTYESLSRSDRKALLSGIMKQRTYDKPDFR